MAGALDNAIAMRNELRSKLRRVEDFIATYRALASADALLPAGRVRACVPGRPAEAWGHIRDVLATSKVPMSRREIVNACADNGYLMPGKRQEDYVGIIVFRHKDQIEIVDGRYLLRPSPSRIERMEDGR